MGLFDDILKENETLIKNEYALDYDFLPKILPFRENEQREIARAIAPLLQERPGRNILIHGPPGIGKTAATRAVIRDLEEETDEIDIAFINCWQQNTSYKILREIAEEIGFKFTQNKNSTELVKIISRINKTKKGIVFIFDEIDKAEDFDFLYNLLEEIHKKTIILITNYKSWLLELDERIKSRLSPGLIEFKAYNTNETKEILKQRLDYAFFPNVWEEDAFNIIAEKAAIAKDIRTGLFMLKEAALEAEKKAKKKITKEDVINALKKIDEFSIKKKTDLDEESQKILDIILKNNGGKIGDLYKLYQKEGGKVSYKTFQRRIAFLNESNFITLTKKRGEGGNTTIINKKITEF